MACFIILATILMVIFSTSSANDFTISWVQSPKESFTSWASRMRFQVNDKLVFKYNEGEDSVLVVTKEDYDSCNVKNPIQKLEDSSFQFTRSGPFYFISGVGGKCSKGEKLFLVVLSERNKKPVIPKPPTTSPSTHVPSSSPSLKPPTQSPTSTPSMAPSVSSSSPTSSMAPSINSPSINSQAPSSFNGGNEPVGAPAQNGKSSATALTASSVTIMMGAITILSYAIILGGF